MPIQMRTLGLVSLAWVGVSELTSRTALRTGRCPQWLGGLWWVGDTGTDGDRGDTEGRAGAPGHQPAGLPCDPPSGGAAGPACLLALILPVLAEGLWPVSVPCF